MPQQIRLSELRAGLASGKIGQEDVDKMRAAGIGILDDETPASAPSKTVADQARDSMTRRAAGGDIPAGSPLDPASDAYQDADALRSAGHGVGYALKHGAIGAGKGVINTAYNVARVVGLRKNVDLEAGLKPQNIDQSIGKFGEQVGEFAGGEALVKGAVAAVPVLAKVAAAAPKAARIVQGAIVGGGVTAAQGGSATTGAAVGAAIPAISTALEPLAGRLRDSAIKSYSRALGATKETMKNMSRRVVAGVDAGGERIPGLIERRVIAWTRKGLSARAASEVENLGEQIDNVWSSIPEGQAMPAAGIKAALSDAKGALSVGDVPIEQSAVRNLERMDKLVDALTDAEGNVDIRQMRKVRQILDRVVAGKGGYAGKQLSLADEAGVAARKELANAIREELANQVPDIAAINREFHFWKTVQDVTDETLRRTAPQSQPLGQQLARVTGAAASHGSIGPAMLTSEAFGLLRKLTTSPAWNTISATAKDRLADLLARGQSARAIAGMRYALQSAVSTSTQSGTPSGGDSLPDLLLGGSAGSDVTSPESQRRPFHHRQVEWPKADPSIRDSDINTHDENDALFVRRFDRNGAPLPSAQIVAMPSDVLPKHFKNARSIAWGSPITGRIDGAPDAFGAYGLAFGTKERDAQRRDSRRMTSAGVRATNENTAELSRFVGTDPGTAAHEVNHAVWEKDLSEPQRQAFRDLAMSQIAAASRAHGTPAFDALAAKIPQAVKAYFDAFHADHEHALDESFAELGAQYILNPSAFKATYPDWYNYFKAIYGVEYIKHVA